ncbi:Vitamin B12-binding protein precursor [Delftia tsuruhatensis]|uniref:ABC transporter substrate-binding protein n=1 Tax=Delftia tsuruhatensis TaxID=180282 RepID=UPI001E7EE80E|nr:helical backbone metal receptor [Delftia tsuruhatensis]CAB5703044.1 Vitamin B12-binding protein precursor [Delftia tsuruhatensis]CAC9684579.1 Vitamin B12-binding protein precursor [Delftia tsuruhatensis]
MHLLHLLLLSTALACAGGARAHDASDAGIPSQASPVYTVTDMRGRQVRLARAPQRIVSLLPSLTESVCALGACERLVGVDEFSNHPARVNGLPRLGRSSAPLVEAAVRLRPDVVLMAYSAPAIAQLERFGIPVLALDASDLAQLEQVLHTLDRLLQTRRAPALLARMQSEVDAQVRDLAARAPAGQKVYFEVEATPYAAGPGSFIGQLLQRLGARNVIPADLGPFPRITPEFVLRQQPELIIHTPPTPSARFAARPGWRRIPAVRSGRICALDLAETDVVSRPGPRLGEAARALGRCLEMPGAGQPGAGQPPGP